MAHADPDNVKNIEKKYLVSKNMMRRYNRVAQYMPGQLATLMTQHFMSLVERAEASVGISNGMDRRRTDCIRAH